MNEDLFTPNMFHKDLAKAKYLCDDDGNFSPKYFLLQEAYQYYLELYLEEILNIRKYEQFFINNPLHFEPVLDTSKDVYQMNSIFTYYYVRNTLYVEKLEQNDIETILQLYQNNVKILSDEMRILIQKTFPIIISSDFSSSNIFTNYGPDSSNYMAPANGLVLGFRYNLYFDAEKNDWLDKNYERTQFLNKILDKQILEYQEKLQFPVKILIYDDQSVHQVRNL